MQIKQKVNIFSLDTTIWTGRRKLRPEDLVLGVGGQLPPAEAASLGSKKVYDPEKINPFFTFRKQGERACEAVGVRIKGLGGFVVSDTDTEVLARELEVIQRNFNAHRDRVFIPEFNKAVEDWVTKFPDFEAALRRAVEKPEEVAKKLEFNFDVFGIEPSQQYGTLSKKMDSLGDRLLDEIAQEANEIYTTSLAPKLSEMKVRRMALNQLSRIRKKLYGLAFLDAAVAPMVGALDRLLAQLPTEGVVQGELYLQALATTLILSDPIKVRQHAEGSLSVQGMAQQLAPTPSVVAAAVQTSLSFQGVAPAVPAPVMVAPVATAPVPVAPAAPAPVMVAPVATAPVPVASAVPAPVMVAPVATASAPVNGASANDQAMPSQTKPVMRRYRF